MKLCLIRQTLLHAIEKSATAMRSLLLGHSVVN